MSNLTKRNRLLLISVIVLAALCITGAAVSLTQIPDIPQQVKPSSDNLFVRLTRPNDQSTWPAGTLISIRANADAPDAIKSFELWADGNLVQTKDATNNSASWSWIVPSEGGHTLVVRAKDAQGHVANSNVVRVTGSPSASTSFDVLVTTQKGDTFDSIAKSFGTTPEKLAAENPHLKSDSALQAGTPIRIPVGFQPLPSSPSPTSSPNIPTQPASLNPPNKFVFWLSNFTGQKPPAAPDLSVKADACTLDLLITDHSNNESGFHVYRLTSSAPSFSLIATLGASGNATLPIQYQDKNVTGLLTYYVTAFNAAGESSSNVASAAISDSTCQTPYWLGQDLQSKQSFSNISVNTSQTSTMILDKAYFYLSINGGARSRFPADPNAFLTLPNGVFNADDQIKAAVTPPTQGSITIDLDAWGWKGGSLIHVGDFSKTLMAQAAPQVAPPQGAAVPNYLAFCVAANECTDVGEFDTEMITQDYRPVWFAWNSGITNTYHGMWEVALIPFLSTCDTPPLDLLATGDISTGTFMIDFSTFKGKTEPLGNTQIGTHGPTNFYIQVLPVINGTPVCQPSNTLQLEAGGPPPPTLSIPQQPPPPPPAPAPPDAYDVKIVDLTPIQFPDYNYQHCILVTSNPYYGNVDAAQNAISNSQGGATVGTTTDNSLNGAIANAELSDPFNYLAQFWAAIPPNTTICPTGYTPPQSSVLDDIASALKTMINGFANLYDELKSLAVQLVEDANPFCQGAKQIVSQDSSAHDNIDSACQTFANATVDAGLAVIGLPPSIPHYDELANSMEDAAANVAVDELGDDCPDADTCKKLVKSGLEEMRQQILSSQTNSSCIDPDTAHVQGFNPLCVPDGVVTEPSPLAKLIPAILTVQVARKPDVPDSAFPDPSQFKVSCGFSASTDAKNDSLIGQSIPIGNDAQTGQPAFWTGTEIEGTLFHDITGKFPQMGLNDPPLTLAFALEPNSVSLPIPGYTNYTGYWLPGALQNAEQAQYQNELSKETNYSDDWPYLYFGSNATVSLKGSCTTVPLSNNYSPSSTPFSDTKSFTMPGQNQ